MEAYMNLPPSTNMTLSSNRNAHQSSQQCLPESQAEELQRHLDEFNRSVTIIIWYKGNVQPIRLQQMIPTFPYFQLSRFQNLIEELGLTNASYLDTYIPSTNQWEQHTIGSIRIVDTQQRLLYKVRCSLMKGLLEDECVSLREELQLQAGSHGVGTMASPSNNSQVAHSNKGPISLSPKSGPEGPLKTSQKRPVPPSDAQDTGHSPKIHVTNGYYMAHSSANAMVSTPVSGAPNSNTSSNVTNSNSQQTSQHPQQPQPQPHSQQQQQQQQDNSVYMYQSPVFYSNSPNPSSSDSNASLPPYLLAPQATAPPIPYHPHPPLKRWPNDYTVSELSAGFHAMDLLIAQSPAGQSMTQRTAFERVFGSRYVKSTVCRHRAVWRKAPRILREQFESMGTDDRACWGEFVRRVENRPPGKNASLDMLSSPQNATMGYHDQHSTADEEEVHSHNQEVMGPMQNQVPPASNANMQNNMGVYDPSRNHLANSGHNG